MNNGAWNHQSLPNIDTSFDGKRGTEGVNLVMGVIFFSRENYGKILIGELFKEMFILDQGSGFIPSPTHIKFIYSIYYLSVL